MNKRKIGGAGEALAAEVVKSRGYRIIAQNYSCPLGEVDIVGLHGRCLVFFEVKCRYGTDYGSPYESVTLAKREHIRKTASYFIKAKGMSGYDVRFDVISISMDHLEDAFR